MTWLLVQCVIYRWVILSIVLVIVCMVLCFKIDKKVVRGGVCVVACVLSVCLMNVIKNDDYRYDFIDKYGVVLEVRNGSEDLKGVFIGKQSVEVTRDYVVRYGGVPGYYNDYEFWPCSGFGLHTGDIVSVSYLRRGGIDDSDPVDSIFSYDYRAWDGEFMCLGVTSVKGESRVGFEDCKGVYDGICEYNKRMRDYKLVY